MIHQTVWEPFSHFDCMWIIPQFRNDFSDYTSIIRLGEQPFPNCAGGNSNAAKIHFFQCRYTSYYENMFHRSMLQLFCSATIPGIVTALFSGQLDNTPPTRISKALCAWTWSEISWEYGMTRICRTAFARTKFEKMLTKAEGKEIREKIMLQTSS